MRTAAVAPIMIHRNFVPSNTKAFSNRLKVACDNMGNAIPVKGEGQQVYFAEKMNVTQEAVRKWFSGESKPRAERMRELAQILNVDEAWLALGIEPEVTRHEKAMLGRKADGAVHAVYGLLTMAGGHCAFPEPHDHRGEYVDLYAILNGRQHAIHVCVGREVAKGQYEFVIPREHDDVRCVGVVHNGGTYFSLLDLRNDLVRKHKTGKGGGFAITCRLSHGEYRTDKDTWNAITDPAAL